MATCVPCVFVDAHRAVLAAAKQVLQARISSHQDKAKLERLLNASFHYLGMQVRCFCGGACACEYTRLATQQGRQESALQTQSWMW